MQYVEEQSSIDKKLQQAKRNSILNKQSSVFKIQVHNNFADINLKHINQNEQSQQESSPGQRIQKFKGSIDNNTYEPGIIRNDTQKSQSKQHNSDKKNVQRKQRDQKQNQYQQNKALHTLFESQENEKTDLLSLDQKPQILSVTSLSKSSTSLNIKKNNNLEQRKNKLSGLQPLKVGNQYQAEKTIPYKRQQSSNPSTPGSRQGGKIREEMVLSKRRETIAKFQNAVKVAVNQAKKQNGLLLGGDNLKSTSEIFKHAKTSNQLTVPPSPGLKGKLSFFDLVKRLKHFAGGKQEEQVQDKSIDKQSGRIDQQEILRKKKERARQLWRKAKSVLRAINIWKRIQNEIQLYGTHNYEFRQTFKVTQEEQKLKRQNTIKRINGENQKKSFNIFIHPDSKFKQLWSIVIIVALIYVGFMMPFSLAFFYKRSPFWYYTDIITDFIFLADVFVTSVSAFYDDDETVLITNNKKIFVKYFKSWFAVDFIASLPINFIDDQINGAVRADGNYLQLLRLVRLPRLHRLLKMSKLLKFVHNYTKNHDSFFKIFEFLQLNAGIMKLLQFIGTVLVCVHVATCFWFMSAKLDNFGPSSWVIRRGIIDEEIGTKYLASLYWAVATVLTVGYGDIHAETITERSLSIIWMMVGVAFYAFTIGIMTSVLAKIDTRETQLNSKLEIIEEFCTEANISMGIKKKIREAIEYHSQRNAFSTIQKYNIFNELPVNLKYEIAVQIHDGAIGKLPFFYNKEDAFVANIVPLLQPLKMLQHEYIYMQEDHPYDIYFIVNGRVNFLMDIGECVFKSWPAGSYFGEIEIIFHKKRMCTAKAEINCDLFTLNKKYYQTIIYNDYPEIEKQLRELALEREFRIQQTLDKANLVLEAIGIQEAQLLPMRKRKNSGKSQISINSKSKKQTLSYYGKISTLRRLAQSFDTAALKSAISSQISDTSKLQMQNQIEEEKSEEDSFKEDEEESKKPINDKMSDSNHDNESSSSGEFNIWGEKDSSSESPKNKTQQSPLKSDRTLLNSNRNYSPQIKKLQDNNNFQKFASLFNDMNKKEKRISRTSLFNKPQATEILSPELLSPELKKNKSEQQQKIDKVKKFEISNEKKKKYFQLDENSQGSKSEKSSKSGSGDDSSSFQKSKKSNASTLPKINIIEESTIDKPNLITEKGHLNKKQLEGYRFTLGVDPNIGSSTLLTNFTTKNDSSSRNQNNQNDLNSFSYSSPKMNNFPTGSLTNRAMDNIIDHNFSENNFSSENIVSLNNDIQRSKIDNFVIPSIKINDETVSKSQFFTQSIKKSFNNFDIDKMNIHDFPHNEQYTQSIPKSIENTAKFQTLSVNDINNLSPTNFSFSKIVEYKSSIIHPISILCQQNNVIECQILPKKDDNKLEINSDKIKIQKMTKIIHDLQSQLNYSQNDQEALHNQVTSLNSTIDLMAKMLKDVVEKSHQRDKKSEKSNKKVILAKTVQRQRTEQKDDKKPKQQSNIQEEHKLQKVRTRDDNDKSNQENLLKQQSFTLNSDNSLVPIQRIINISSYGKTSNSTNQDQKKKESQMLRFSFTDDLQQLQDDSDPLIPSVLSSLGDI